MKFTILVNRTTAHISTGLIREGASDETMNRCSAVTRGNLATRGQDHDNGADALKAAHAARAKVCKTCVKVVEEILAAEAAAPADEQAPAVTAVVLPQGVTMDDATRILSGPVKHMKSLYESGVAVIRDGDLVLI